MNHVTAAEEIPIDQMYIVIGKYKFGVQAEYIVIERSKFSCTASQYM